MILQAILTVSSLAIIYFGICYAQQSVSVSVKSGQINGISKSVDGNDVNVFLGIPYAQPPIGQLRFKKPLPLTQPLGSYDAIEWSNPCIQPEFLRDSFQNKNFSEDCLYLNIWSPSDVESIESTELKPVMFFIHGGALILGSSNQFMYSGDILSTKGDVIVVTINYRLSVFGFFYSGTDDAPGNVGLWDQALALEWVNDNIRYFGGDPNKITIFGESAGSWSVSLHLLSPITRNMYQNAIMMSGAVINSEVIDEPIVAKSKWLNGAKLVGCTDESSKTEITPKILDCLYNIDSNSLLRMIELKQVKQGTACGVYPVIDGVFVPNSPKQLIRSGQFKTGANILMGTTEDEGSSLMSLFVDYNNYYHPITPKNLSYSEAYQEVVNLIESDLCRVKINGEEVAKVYFTEISPNSEDYDLLRRTIGIAVGDYYIGCPTTHFGLKLFENDRKRTNVYQYHYNNKLAVKFICSAWMGACHGDDIWPVFGVPFLLRDQSIDAERDESLNVIEFFTHFAKYGHPSPQNGKDWPKYYTNDDNVIAPYFDMKHNKFRIGLKHIECEILFKRYLEQ